jgi:hypothetical protein
MAIQALLCGFARKIVIMASTNVEDIQLMNAFTVYATCEFTIMSRLVFRPDKTDFSEELRVAKGTGARYFVIFASPQQMAALLEQGYAAGVLGANTVVSTSTRGANMVTSYFSPETDVAKVMTGFFVYQYWPNYYVNRTAEARGFSKRWTQQPSTMGWVVDYIAFVFRQCQRF